MMFNLVTSGLACVIFSCGLFNAKAQKQEVTDNGDIGFCLKQCTAKSNCICKAAPKNSPSILRFCDKDPGQQMGHCSYCIRTYSPCKGPGQEKFFCCAEIGRDKEYENKTVECRESSGGTYKCLQPCSSFIKKNPCIDIDGYATSSSYSSCAGPYKYSYMKCDGSICSATGGICGDGKHNCCKEDFTCNKGKCRRKCIDIGSSCKGRKAIDCCVRAGKQKVHACENSECTDAEGDYNPGKRQKK